VPTHERAGRARKVARLLSLVLAGRDAGANARAAALMETWSQADRNVAPALRGRAPPGGGLVSCPCGGSVTCLGDCTLPELPTCFHCDADLVDGVVFEGNAGNYCSTRCFVAVETCSHRESCERAECADGAPATLPQQLCAYCDEPTADRATAHEGCREKARNAFGYQAGALAARRGATS
jgi:hypothetical protein